MNIPDLVEVDLACTPKNSILVIGDGRERIFNDRDMVDPYPPQIRIPTWITLEA